MPYVWLAVIVASICIEATTSQLVSIWFAIGGVAALISSLCGGAVWLQCLLFVLVTALTLFATRPFVRKKMSFQKVRTNADRYVGQEAIVLAAIDNAMGVGEIKVRGSVWTARSADNSRIEKGSVVQIRSIEGVKMIVEKVPEIS